MITEVQEKILRPLIEKDMVAHIGTKVPFTFTGESHVINKLRWWEFVMEDCKTEILYVSMIRPVVIAVVSSLDEATDYEG